MDEFQEAQQDLRDLLADAEEELTEVCTYPASITVRIGRKTGTLHFDGQSLSFTEAPDRLPRCRICKSSCEACAKRNKLKQNPQKPETVDVQTISDPDTLIAIVKYIPIMHRRLVRDSKVNPEEIMKAVAEARVFLDAIES